MSESSNKKGMTLLEVVVATAVMSIGLTVITQAFLRAAQATALSGDLTQAVFLGENILEEVMISKKEGFLKDGVQRFKKTQGKLDAVYLLEPLGADSLHFLDVHVVWRGHNINRSMDVRTFL